MIKMKSEINSIRENEFYKNENFDDLLKNENFINYSDILYYLEKIFLAF